ncbi:MAG: NAD-dependent epimerase/dehydratase family protein [Thermotogota bacterium]|nr:NAD-dependent epimerase/dehydratase family protein [Thermotogota bacterium]
MYWKDKRVLVTGGAGVIGEELIIKLVESGAHILCLDICSKPKEIPNCVEYYKTDISEMEHGSIIEFNPEIIFHLAATFERTEETPEFWEENFKNNTLLSHKIVETAEKCTNLEKFVFASSYLIYSPSLYLYPEPQSDPRKLKEVDLVNPRNLCGAAKYYTEKELEFVNSVCSDFISISARIFRVYGLGSRDIISRWVRMALNGEELTVFQKENMFDYIFAGDVAEGLIKMTENVDEDEIINLGTGTARKVEYVVKILQEQIPDIKIKETEKRGLFEASCADISKLIELTGWQPTLQNIEEGVKRVVDYEKRTLEGG